ncbi:Spore cortex-lytic enzyme precursor [Anoxybacillus sp. BCO1]|nr:Spore cortex-lytic enzyme precursor [Anoxybacillus sp. BCO1]
MRKWLALASAFVAAFCFSTTEVAAQTTVHYVKQGETFWTIAKSYNVSLLELQRVNQKQSDILFVGEALRIPQPISQADKDLLARLVHAEAKGEPFAGKVAVATVVLNRVDHPNFPNTIRQVIYERSGDIMRSLLYKTARLTNQRIEKHIERLRKPLLFAV